MVVVERMDESLLVLKLLLGLQLGDTVVLSSKQSGSYYLGGPDPDRCVMLIKPFTPPKVNEYIVHDFEGGG
jgi:hypothetical protein